MTTLQDAIGTARPADLLPPRRSDEATRVELPWEVVAAIDLGPSRVDGSPGLLLVLADARGARYGVPAVLDAGRLRRAIPGDGVSEALVARLADQSTSDLSIESFAPTVPLTGERAIAVDQTNELVVVGERAVVKWVLHPTEDVHPAPARLAALARAGFQGTPRPWGVIRLGGPHGALVAMVVDYVPDALDGWDWAVADVRALARGDLSALEMGTHVRAVAELVAGMHIALAGADTSIASSEDARGWYSAALLDADAALLPVGLDGRARKRMQPIAGCAGTVVMDVHGDLHVGQILRSATTGRYCVIDFDGNPVLEPDERVARQPAARDVAGMLASLDHVGRVVLHRTDDLDETQRARVVEWIEDAQTVFADAYILALRNACRADLLDQGLVDAFQVQQECREYAYAARYLPHWRYVPDAALPALLSRGTT